MRVWQFGVVQMLGLEGLFWDTRHSFSFVMKPLGIRYFNLEMDIIVMFSYFKVLKLTTLRSEYQCCFLMPDT